MSMLTEAVIPAWARSLGLSVAAAFAFMFGQMRGERVAGQRHIDYVTAQAAQTIKIAKAQQIVVAKTEIEYRDRIQKIYVKGDVIEKEIPTYVTQTDNAGCTINTGFVRIHDAAWSGEPAGPAAESDREPAGVSLAEAAEVDTHNATACLAWREQALGFRDLYRRLSLASDSLAP